MCVVGKNPLLVYAVLLLIVANRSPIDLYLTLLLKIFIPDGHIDDKFLEKNLCHSRDSNHRSPVFRTGTLTT